MTWSRAALAASTSLASAVELVEAVTIVLAMGLTRGWRSALWGAAFALVALTAITAVAGYALVRLVPASLLQLVVGSLLLVFGLQWLRKAILRSSGLKAHHDEDAVFRSEVEAARQAASGSRLGLDWFGFVVSFKGVLLEGLEIVFIVITFGSSAGDLPLAAAGAAAGAAVVLAAAVALHRPLARVPENAMKLTVGLMLTTFGTFWAVEGLGVFRAGERSVQWPGGDLSLPLLLAFWCGLTWAAVAALRTPRGQAQ